MKSKVTPERLLQIHDEVCKEARQIILEKNHDYSCGSENIFANFELADPVLGIANEMGILLRVLDKIGRLKTFIVKGVLKVAEESVKVAIIDIINYLIILLGMWEEKQLTKQ